MADEVTDTAATKPTIGDLHRADTEKAWIARVLDEAMRRVDDIEGGKIRVDGRGEVWIHTQEQVKTWLVGMIADALRDRWEWTDGSD